MKWLSTLERKHIPNFRRNKYYKIAKVVILTPIVFPVYLIQTGVQYVISKINIKRKDKPDINFCDNSHVSQGEKDTKIVDRYRNEVVMTHYNRDYSV